MMSIYNIIYYLLVAVTLLSAFFVVAILGSIDIVLGEIDR
jgi:NADH:ubiquinone oxidoreductase subunit D